ncbi:MAG: TadE-like protein [Bacillales bacterium]|jgi:hypothetical protein|nr:TadE-like protein [Bacillales bacterium]
MRLIERIFKEQCGSLTVEATLSVPIFMFAFLLLISFANQARTESIVQHTISQTAKDLSTYFYLADKAKIPSYGSDVTVDTTKKFAQNFLSLSKLPLLDDSSIKKSSPISLKDKINPSQFLNSLVDLVIKKGSQELMLKTLVYPYCQLKFEENLKIEGSKKQIDEYLKSLQINNGRNGLDFSDSKILLDGKTIEIVVTYHVKSMFPMIFNRERTVRQSASTAAWIKHMPFKVENHLSKWKLGSLIRGRAWIDEIRKENAEIAVAPGVGVDLYSNGNCTYVYSMNVFSSSYCVGDIKENSFELNKQGIKAQLDEYADKSLSQINKLPAQIEFQNGKIIQVEKDKKVITLQIIVPEEAAQFNNYLYQLSEEIKNDKGISIFWTFREKAL